MPAEKNNQKVFLDTSVFIRFLTRDDEKKFSQCFQLFELIQSGKIKPYASNIVIQEILYVLTKIYKHPKVNVLMDIDKILSLRNLTLIERTNTTDALSLFRKYKIKYGDCLIATQVPRATTLITYDADFSKIRKLKPTTPANIGMNTK